MTRMVCSRRLASTVAVAMSFLVLAACGGGGSDAPAPSGGTPPPATPTPVPPPAPPADPDPIDPPQGSPSASLIESESQAVRFLSAATFGPAPDDIDALVGRDAADWLAAEFAKPASKILPAVQAEFEDDGDVPYNTEFNQLWDAMLTGNDQLRLRMQFALSQILVVSGRGGDADQVRLAHYMDILSSGAFGNYRDLLETVTYSPAMSRYLTYHRNQKGDPDRGRTPDENYARELMQLFTIGLVELDMNGEPKLGSDGRLIETYDNDDIIGLARVFTGLSDKGTGWWQADPDANWKPLQAYPERHSPLDKTFLGRTIPAGTGPEESIDIALDTLFEHPNMAPFLARHLIQRFTRSHPEPAYVGRVAEAFASGQYAAQNGQTFGRGRRGDLVATLAAVLLDEAFLAPGAGSFEDDGKIREPVLRFTHWVRAFRVRNIDAYSEYRLGDTRDPGTRLGQHPFRSPSVFNFYRPGFVAPGTESGSRGLTTPEFQIVNEASALGFANFMTDFVFNRSPSRSETVDTFLPDYSDEVAMADDPEMLAAHLDLLLTGGRMSDATRTSIAETVATIPLPETDQDADRLKRVHVAVLMAVNAPAYAILR